METSKRCRRVGRWNCKRKRKIMRRKKVVEERDRE
jgi:hypothetical protein